MFESEFKIELLEVLEDIRYELAQIKQSLERREPTLVEKIVDLKHKYPSGRRRR